MKKIILLFVLFIFFQAAADWPWIEDMCYNPKCPKEKPIQFWKAKKGHKFCEDIPTSQQDPEWNPGWKGECRSCEEVDYFRIKTEEDCKVCPNAAIGKAIVDGSLYCHPAKRNINGRK